MKRPILNGFLFIWFHIHYLLIIGALLYFVYENNDWVKILTHLACLFSGFFMVVKWNRWTKKVSDGSSEDQSSKGMDIVACCVESEDSTTTTDRPPLTDP